MKYQLINTPNIKYSTTEQILINRGIPKNEITHYLYPTDKDINDYKLLDENKLRAAVKALITAVNDERDAALIIDADCDGFCSSALLLNYLYNLYPTWVQNHILLYFHTDKQHGLADCVDWILQQQVSLVIVPDAGSNDIKEQELLAKNNISTIILDHHDLIKHSDKAIVINIQELPYPNKELAGTGVTWQFCRYIDSLLNTDFSQQYLDLVALACVGDMMSLKSIETKYLIEKGFKQDNIHNNFIIGMWEKNQFKLGTHLTPMGAAFYIVPLLNAVVRSGNQQEKQIVFKSMLDYCANNNVLSTKRGHKLDEQESILQQALRICQNVKARQTRAQNASLKVLQNKIDNEHLLDNKVILLLLDKNEIDKNIAGLIANHIASEYQRPCCILIKGKDNVYHGSARGYEKAGIQDFKQLCENTECIEYAAGHPNAFGLGISEPATAHFIESLNQQLQDISTEAMYYVDFIYRNNQIDADALLTIGDLNYLWGKDLDEPLIAIEGLKISKNMVSLLSPDKNPTLKITLPNQVVLIKFGITEEEYQQLLSEGYVEINVIGRANNNEWQGNITPQLLITDYEIINIKKYLF